MTYSPNIFSTKAGLTRNIVIDWVHQEDTQTIKRWLTEGEKHPRLAMEALIAALNGGSMELAEMIWQAQWHSPNKTFTAMWDVPRNMDYQARRLEQDPSYLATRRRIQPDYPDWVQLRSRREKVIDWLLSKSHPDQTTSPFKARNAGLISGLIAAFENDDEPLWDRILAMKPKLDVSEGNDLLGHVLMRIEGMPNPFSHNRAEKPKWVNDRVLSDILAHGVRPGGSIWVAAASTESARPILDLLIPRAAELTTPRQRTAILIHAAEQKSIYFDRLLDAFLPLGFPESISLTPSEVKKGEQYFSTLYLRDRSNDFSFVKIKDPYGKKLLKSPAASLSEALGQQGWSEIVRKHLTKVAKDKSSASASPDTAAMPKI